MQFPDDRRRAAALAAALRVQGKETLTISSERFVTSSISSGTSKLDSDLSHSAASCPWSFEISRISRGELFTRQVALALSECRQDVGPRLGMSTTSSLVGPYMQIRLKFVGEYGLATGDFYLVRMVDCASI